jgi:hypothetical protein
MSRGYIILAQNSGNYDYIRLAYALALSIKNTQSTVNKVCLATDASVADLDPKVIELFDDIVPVPWIDQAESSVWKIENTWKFYHMSPYDETVILDADMLFPADISDWWDIMSTQDVWSTNKPRTFKGELITSTKYRRVFTTNDLPNFHIAFTYFKKSKFTAELFNFIEIIFNNWERFFYNYLDENRPAYNSGDVAYALAIKLLGVENECFGNSALMPSFVHMKGHLQNIGEHLITEDWTKHIPTYFREDGTFKIGNYEQKLPFHYHVKEWLTDDMIKILEKRVALR